MRMCIFNWKVKRESEGVSRENSASAALATAKILFVSLGVTGAPFPPRGGPWLTCSWEWK